MSWPEHIVRQLDLSASLRVELRRLDTGGASWFVVREDGAVLMPVTVVVAAALCGDWWEVVQATRAELGHCDPTGTWRGRPFEEHPSEDPGAGQLWQEWRDTWGLIAEQRGTQKWWSVPAAAVPAAFEAARELSPAVNLRVELGGPEELPGTIEAALAELSEREENSIAVLDASGGYVQVMDSKSRSALYLEASDPGHQDDGPLEPARRKALAMLGWFDPKAEPMPYESAGYAQEWTGGNFAREWPRHGDPAELAHIIADTLATVSPEGFASLGVEVFPTAT